jgi:hypothetical protein
MPPLPPDTTIMQVLPRLDAGGVERGTVEIAQAIAAAGGRPLVVSAGGRLVPAIERAGGGHVALPLSSKSPLTIWRNAGRLAGLAAANDVRIIHARSRAPAWSAYHAARRAGLPFVTTYHAPYREDSPGKRWYNSVMPTWWSSAIRSIRRSSASSRAASTRPSSTRRASCPTGSPG